MTTHPSLPTVTVRNRVMSDAYVAEAIADEKQLAALLGWTVCTAPHDISPTINLRGSKGWTFATSSGLEKRPNPSEWMPQWRRSWAGAGELIAPFQMMIVCTAVNVAVSCPDHKSVHASFTDHPSRGAAIWFAMCKAAIAYLTSTTTERKT